MKKSVKGTVMFSIALGVTLLSPGTFGAGIEYKGVDRINTLYKNINFSDIHHHWAEESILKMASFSIIRGMGSQTYKPDGYVTREEALAFLVRLKGLEEQAQTLAEDVEDSNQAWSEGYIQTAVDAGIINQDEVALITDLSESATINIDDRVYNRMLDYEKDLSLSTEDLETIEEKIRTNLIQNATWKRNVTREQLFVWFSRVIDSDPIKGPEQQLIYRFKDFKKVSIAHMPIIESLLQNGMVSGSDDGYLYPKRSIKRGEMAALLSRAFEVLHEGESKVGQIINVETYTTTEKTPYASEDREVRKTTISLLTETYELDKIQCQGTDNGKENRGFVVYDKDKLSSWKALREGQKVKIYLNKDGEVIYAQML